MERVVSAVVFVSLFVVVDLVISEPFTVDCQLPFENLKKHHPIDDNCAAQGEKSSYDPPDNVEPHELQNKTKNNFCAPTQNPALVTFVSFRKLQQKLYGLPGATTWGKYHLPDDRGILRNIYTTSENATIGEGSVVTFAAWLMKVRPGSVESCNCGSTNGSDPEMTDLHLVLIESSPTSNCSSAINHTLECKSVTAEVSPHFRPEQWNKETICTAALEHPLRFTGQLMYDASHRAPCSRRGSKDPYRRSGWEIHPVYAIDVCDNMSLSKCKADHDSVWKPLDQWQPPN
jgi:hypothetical protein